MHSLISYYLPWLQRAIQSPQSPVWFLINIARSPNSGSNAIVTSRSSTWRQTNIYTHVLLSLMNMTFGIQLTYTISTPVFGSGHKFWQHYLRPFTIVWYFIWLYNISGDTQTVALLQSELIEMTKRPFCDCLEPLYLACFFQFYWFTFTPCSFSSNLLIFMSTMREIRVHYLATIY